MPVGFIYFYNSDRSTIIVVACRRGAGKSWGRGVTKGHGEYFGGDRYVHYLACGDALLGVHK